MNLFSNVSNKLNLSIDEYLSQFSAFNIFDKLVSKVEDKMLDEYSDIDSDTYKESPDDAIYLQYLYSIADPQPTEDDIHEGDYYYIDTTNTAFRGFKKVDDKFSYIGSINYYVIDRESQFNKIQALEELRNLYPLVWNVFKLLQARINVIDPINLYYVASYCYRLKGRIDSLKILMNYLVGNDDSIVIEYANTVEDQFGEKVPVNLHSYKITINQLDSVISLSRFKIDLLILSKDLLFNTSNEQIDIKILSYNYVVNTSTYILSESRAYNYWKINFDSNNMYLNSSLGKTTLGENLSDLN